MHHEPPELRLPELTRGPLRDHHLVARRDREPPVGDAEADPPGAALERALAPGNLDGVGRPGCGGRQRLIEGVDPAEQRPELEAAEDLLQLRPVGRREGEPGWIPVEVEVAAHRRELLGDSCLVGVLGDVARARRGQLGGVLDHRLERAVLGDELPGGLVADPGDAGDVVGRVALEADEVRDLVRPHPVARPDSLGRVDLDVRDAARRHHQADALGAELERVAVGRDDAGTEPAGGRAGRERGDHVVRLPPVELEVPVAEGLDDRPEVRELLAQQVRHRPASLLVDDVGCLGDGGPMHRPRVPGDRHAARPVVRQQLEQHVREPEQRVRRLPVRRRELLRQREERAVGEIVAVDEEQIGVVCGPVVELQLLAGQCLR